MDLSGIIFVVLALAWAVYLIPKALKHHDEVARTRSIDRFSTAMRVLARREPVSRRDARLVVAPGRAADNPRVVLPRRSEGNADVATPAAVPPVPRRAERAAARAAARRRRRILSVLLAATLVVTMLAALAVVSWSSVTVPAGLTLLYLFLCRTQVRRSRRLAWEADLEAAAEEESVAPARRVAARLETHEAAPVVAVRNAQGFEEIDPNEDTVAIPVPVLDAVAVPTEDGGSLWDPLPVTLPTYVTKPKARRTVRTIDLGEPGTWTSGRSAEDTALVAEAAEAAETAESGQSGQSATAEPDYDIEQQRAVGS